MKEKQQQAWRKIREKLKNHQAFSKDYPKYSPYSKSQTDFPQTDLPQTDFPQTNLP